MPLKPKKVISLTFTALILLLALPASAILASWSSIPGDTLYPIKRSLEKASLSLLPSSFLEMKLRYTFLDQRTTEAIATIQSSTDSRALDDIITEAQAAQLALVNLETDTQSQATEQLIEKLAETNRELETIKQSPSDTQAESVPAQTSTLAYQPQSPIIIYQPTTTIIYKTTEPETPVIKSSILKPAMEPQPLVDKTSSTTIPTQVTSSVTQTLPTQTNTTPTITPTSPTTTPSIPQTTDQQIHQTQIEISKVIIELQQDHQPPGQLKKTQDDDQDVVVKDKDTQTTKQLKDKDDDSDDNHDQDDDD